MQPTIPALLLALSSMATSMCAAAVALLAIGLLATKNAIAQARGIDKIGALAPVCFAIALAVFGAEHFSSPQAMLPLVPSFMPVRIVWVYFVGVALIAASLSMAIRRWVEWSGLLFGVMMFLFVAMLHLPGAAASGSRILWTIVFRESSFGGGGWVLAGIAMGAGRAKYGKVLITVGRVLIGITAIFFGVQHFLHPTVLPGVPLAKLMPSWVPVPAMIDYVTGASLFAGGVCFLLGRKSHLAATYLGAWILFLIVTIYTPVLIGALGDPRIGVQVEGVNYFADTLLFAGAILSLAAPGGRSQSKA